MNEAIEIYKESCDNLLKENKKMCGIAIKALSDKAELETELKDLKDGIRNLLPDYFMKVTAPTKAKSTDRLAEYIKNECGQHLKTAPSLGDGMIEALKRELNTTNKETDK